MVTLAKVVGHWAGLQVDPQVVSHVDVQVGSWHAVGPQVLLEQVPEQVPPALQVGEPG